jgi:hypothetical protein
VPLLVPSSAPLLVPSSACDVCLLNSFWHCESGSALPHSSPAHSFRVLTSHGLQSARDLVVFLHFQRLLAVFCGTARDSSQFSSQASRKVSLVVLDSLSLFLTGQEKETSFFVLVHSSCPANSYASIVFPVDLQGCVLHVVLSTGQP